MTDLDLLKGFFSCLRVNLSEEDKGSIHPTFLAAHVRSEEACGLSKEIVDFRPPFVEAYLAK